MDIGQTHIIFTFPCSLTKLTILKSLLVISNMDFSPANSGNHCILRNTVTEWSVAEFLDVLEWVKGIQIDVFMLRLLIEQHRVLGTLPPLL